MRVLLKNIFLKELILLKRYAFNSVDQIITLYLLFLVLFWGAKSVGIRNPFLSSTLDSLVVGYLLWFLILIFGSDLSQHIVTEASTGTLEQLFLSPFGFYRILMAKMAAIFFTALMYIVPLLFLTMATTGRWLHLDIISLIPLLILTLASVFGVGLATSGLALVFKQVQSVHQIMQFLWVGLIAAPVDKIPLLKLLPVSLGSSLITQMMSRSKPLWTFPAGDLLLLGINGFIYCLMGLWVYQRCERHAKIHGIVGHF